MSDKPRPGHRFDSNMKCQDCHSTYPECLITCQAWANYSVQTVKESLLNKDQEIIDHMEEVNRKLHPGG